MESAPGQPGEEAFESLVEEALGSGPEDSFAGAPESFDEPEPPDLGESLQQMNARLEEMSQRLDQADDDYDEDGWDPDALQYNPTALEQPEGEGLDQNEVLRQLLAEEVSEQVKPYVDAVENSFREQQILQLAERHPILREPDVLDAVSQELEQFAEAYGNPGALTDPRLIEQFLLAHMAQKAAAETPEPAAEGATLEAGVGPGAPAEPEVDAATRAWMDAARPNPQGDVFS